jgi:hypothetical protein
MSVVSGKLFCYNPLNRKKVGITVQGNKKEAAETSVFRGFWTVVSGTGTRVQDPLSLPVYCPQEVSEGFS